MTWFRILWSGKTTRNVGFELVEAGSPEQARKKFESTSEMRRVEKVEEVDLVDYVAAEPNRNP